LPGTGDDANPDGEGASCVIVRLGRRVGSTLMPTGTADGAAVDLTAAATFDAGFPHEYFTQLRVERPIFRAEHPVWPGGFWNVVRHAEVVQVSRDPATWSSQPTPFLEAGDEDGASSMLLISLDPPEHTKMRLLVNRGFTPRRVQDLTAKIQSTVDRLLDAQMDRGGCDLVHDVAVELPLQVIADLVGVPEEDRHQIFAWTEQTFGFDASVTPEQRSAAAIEMYAYADRMCAIRAEHPDRYDDLISVLMDAEIDGESLTQMQIAVFFLLLQNAGSETTRNLITSGTVALLEHPEQMELLRAEPARIPNAIEELLRWTSPVVQFVRRARHDTELAGQTIAAGEPVAMWYPSANRDDTVFAEPFRLDVTRDATAQVSFGAGGPHFCLGASLARLEARIMFEALLGRIDGMELAVPASALPRVNSCLIDGLASLPVRWERVRSVPA
jgi:cytochrome P450